MKKEGGRAFLVILTDNEQKTKINYGGPDYFVTTKKGHIRSVFQKIRKKSVYFMLFGKKI